MTAPAPRRIPLYGWLTAEAISLLGTRVSMIAIPWLVLVTTGSARAGWRSRPTCCPCSPSG